MLAPGASVPLLSLLLNQESEDVIDQSSVPVPLLVMTSNCVVLLSVVVLPKARLFVESPRISGVCLLTLMLTPTCWLCTVGGNSDRLTLSRGQAAASWCSRSISCPARTL